MPERATHCFLLLERAPASFQLTQQPPLGITISREIKMQNFCNMLAASLCLASPLSFAQSAVSIFGLIDLGVTHYSSTKPSGSGLTRMDSGQAQGRRRGFRGTEDLGAGLNPLFLLKSGFKCGRRVAPG
jgi:hypothetical protein